MDKENVPSGSPSSIIPNVNGMSTPEVLNRVQNGSIDYNTLFQACVTYCQTENKVAVQQCLSHFLGNKSRNPGQETGSAGTGSTLSSRATSTSNDITHQASKNVKLPKMARREIKECDILIPIKEAGSDAGLCPPSTSGFGGVTNNVGGIRRLRGYRRGIRSSEGNHSGVKVQDSEGFHSQNQKQGGFHGGNQKQKGFHCGNQNSRALHSGIQNAEVFHSGIRKPEVFRNRNQNLKAFHGGIRKPEAFHSGIRKPVALHGGIQDLEAIRVRNQNAKASHDGIQNATATYDGKHKQEAHHNESIDVVNVDEDDKKLGNLKTHFNHGRSNGIGCQSHINHASNVTSGIHINHGFQLDLQRSISQEIRNNAGNGSKDINHDHKRKLANENDIANTNGGPSGSNLASSSSGAHSTDNSYYMHQMKALQEQQNYNNLVALLSNPAFFTSLQYPSYGVPQAGRAASPYPTLSPHLMVPSQATGSHQLSGPSQSVVPPFSTVPSQYTKPHQFSVPSQSTVPPFLTIPPQLTALPQMTVPQQLELVANLAQLLQPTSPHSMLQQPYQQYPYPGAMANNFNQPKPSNSKPSMPENREKCVVCNDKAKRIRHGVISCEACASFFARSIDRKMVYKCKNGKNCEIKDKYRCCLSCRLQRCFISGMKLDYGELEKLYQSTKKAYDDAFIGRKFDDIRDFWLAVTDFLNNMEGLNDVDLEEKLEMVRERGMAVLILRAIYIDQDLQKHCCQRKLAVFKALNFQEIRKQFHVFSALALTEGQRQKVVSKTGADIAEEYSNKLGSCIYVHMADHSVSFLDMMKNISFLYRE
ncbi:unnamed protein product [Bursaphelenchus okinawaensis]|uniref:Nuclear receptor domain-containing protein n=1 Tax=Bursaphelenchus okinawaensis TaxID=465554 RepID=A0A811JV59_9BILA|nr:unnamed protein product [Bursaphelenchus okinawaensis]CAG9084699.1 unnamed protein product [Bursaphelenchus okinawaensis]